MTNDNQIKKHPFTREQLDQFKNELIASGSIDELMLEKQALKKDGETTTIISYENMEEYKEKFLTGVYEPLRPLLTPVPCVLWSKLYEVLVKEGSI